jgi:hypothetical protein
VPAAAADGYFLTAATVAGDPVVTTDDTNACVLMPTTDLGVTAGACADVDSATATCEYVPGTYADADLDGTPDTQDTAESCTSYTAAVAAADASVTACTSIEGASAVACTTDGDSVPVAAEDGYFFTAANNNLALGPWVAAAFVTACNLIEGASAVTCTDATDSVPTAAADGYFFTAANTNTE